MLDPENKKKRISKILKIAQIICGSLIVVLLLVGIIYSVLDNSDKDNQSFAFADSSSSSVVPPSSGGFDFYRQVFDTSFYSTAFCGVPVWFAYNRECLSPLDCFPNLAIDGTIRFYPSYSGGGTTIAPFNFVSVQQHFIIPVPHTDPQLCVYRSGLGSWSLFVEDNNVQTTLGYINQSGTRFYFSGLGENYTFSYNGIMVNYTPLNDLGVDAYSNFLIFVLSCSFPVNTISSTLSNSIYQSGYLSGYDTGYTGSYEVGWQAGNQYGYNQGYAAGVASVPSEISNPISFLLGPVDTFMHIKLFGDISIGLLLGILLCVAVSIIFIKFFAGG